MPIHGHRASFTTQIRDGFTLANVVWIVGVIGITFSVYPALRTLLPPLWQRLRPYLEALYNPLLQYARPSSEVAPTIQALC